jgi:hypothetical protein
VDADNVRRGMLACSLPAWRYSLEFAKSAEKGLELLGHVHPDVVIIGQDSASRDLCQRIRSLPSGTNCTLVLMDERYRDEITGKAETEGSGADAFLPFPFATTLFEQRLRSKLRPLEAMTARPKLAAATLPFPPPMIHHEQKPPEDTRADDSGWEGFSERVCGFFENLDKLDYYTLLQIPANASAAAIKDAYFNCSIEFHPDRFLQLTDERLREKIYEVYKRMSEAFKVLSNPETRCQYDAMLVNPERQTDLRYLERGTQHISSDDFTSDAMTPAGKKYLHFANLAEVEGNLRSARMYLTLALQWEPHNDSLRMRLEDITNRLES